MFFCEGDDRKISWLNMNADEKKKLCMLGKKLNRRGTPENYYYPCQKPNRSATAEVKEPHAV